MTAAASPDDASVPSPAPDATPAAIRDSLVDEERVVFEAAYRDAMAVATETLDLAPVLDVLRAYHRIAAQTRHHGAAAHQRMLDRARSIVATGVNPDAVDPGVHREHVERRLGR